MNRVRGIAVGGVGEDEQQAVLRLLEQMIADVRVAGSDASVGQARQVGDEEIRNLVDDLLLTMPQRARVLLVHDESKSAKRVAHVVGIRPSRCSRPWIVDASGQWRIHENNHGRTIRRRKVLGAAVGRSP